MATRTLLCVEPDSAVVDFLRGALGMYGFQIKTVTGDQAVPWAKQNRPALMMVAVEPRKIGYAVCNKIKRADELKGVPLILTSSEETQETFEQHKKLKSRADEYMLKPLARDELLRKINLLIGLDEMQAASGPVTSEEILLTGESDEISIGDNDIVEEKSSPFPSPFHAGMGTVGDGKDDEYASFEQETEAAFAAIRSHDPTGPLLAPPAPPPESKSGAEAFKEESTRAAEMPSFDFAFPDSEPHKVSRAVPAPDVPSPDDVLPAGAMHDVSTPISLSPELEARAKKLADRANELETENGRLRTEVEDLRSRLSAQPLMKEKDLLGLREIINRKEKDLLDLRDGLDSKDRQILDHKDRIREHERARRDLEEKMLGIEKNLVAANERVAALGQDKDKSIERERGLKARLDDALSEIQKAHDEVDVLKKKLASAEERGRGDLDRLRADLESRMVELEESHRRELTKVIEERQASDEARDRDHQGEIARLSATHASEIEARDKRIADELADATMRHQNEIEKLRRDHEKALASLKEEQTLQLAAERQAHETSVEAKERDHKNEILALRRRQEEELAAGEERRQRELTEAEIRREGDLEAAETRRRTELQARDEEHHVQIAEMDRRHFQEKTELSERHRGEIDQTHSRASRAEGDLAARTEELSETQRRLMVREADLEAARAELREREVKLSQARDRNTELEARMTEYEEQVLRAYQKLRSDEKSIDKAKRALAVALNLLEERGAVPASAAPASSGGAVTPGRNPSGPSTEESPT